MKGALSKGVWVHSNAPLSNRIRLNITANVKPPINVAPTDEPKLRTLTGQKLTVYFDLTNAMDKPLKIKGVHSHLGEIAKAELSEVKPGRVWRLKVDVFSETPVSKAAPLELKLDSTDISNFMIYTRVEIND